MTDTGAQRGRRLTVVVTVLAAGRAVAGHLTLPLLVVVRGLPFLGLVLLRPNEATLAIGGAQASAGRLPWALLFAAAVVGAVASDGLSYALGHTVGEAALARLVTRRHGRLSRIVDRSRGLVEQHGTLAVAAARPTVVTHGIIPVLAGIGRLSLVRFVFASAAGAVIWAALWLGAAALIADAAREAEPAVLAAAVVAIGVAAALTLRECLRRPACLGPVA